MIRCKAVPGLQLALFLVSCGGDQFTTAESEPQGLTGGAESLGGSEAMDPPASGGEATGGAPTGGASAGGSTGGEPAATGGMMQPPAPADVPCSPISCAESVIARYDDGAPRCFDVEPYAFVWGIVERVSVQGECFATLDGEPIEPEAVPWAQGTRLLVWNCGFELSCSEF